jgi:hypothetical protein
MPVSQDQGDQLELSRTQTQDGAQGADSPGTADRPTRGSAADLRQRLERLPQGHPSSPYHDDGTPKPPLAQLKNLELPLPGEEREPNGGMRRDASAPRVTTPRANDRAAVTEADAGVASYPDPDVQDRQAAAPEPDPAALNQEPERREPGNREPADSESSAWEHLSAPGATRGRSAEPQDQRATQEHAQDAHGEALAPARDGELGDDEPATQDQPAIRDDQAPAPADQPDVRRGEQLTPEQVRLAVRTLGQCRLAEGRSVFGSYGDSGLTPAMRRIEDQLEHGELVPETEKYALKSLDRFQEKLAKQIERNPDKSPEELAHEIHDGVRYTFIFDEDSYYDGTWEVHSRLKEQEFDLEFRRNTWSKPDYKGINSRWRDPTNDVVFEVQFHTIASWDAKQRTHDDYEKISDVNIPRAERKRLEAAQKEVSDTVPLPPRCTEIPDYRKEG